MRIQLFCMGIVGLFLANLYPAYSQNRGILNQIAPPLGVTEWTNLADKRKHINITDLKGKVVYLYAFQKW